MNKKFLSAILFGALMVTSTGTFVSCKDYDDDIDGINKELTEIKSQIAALQGKIEAGKWITSVTPATGGFTVTFSDGSNYTITNGKDGQDGAAGAAGAAGTQWTISADGYWECDGVKTEVKAVGQDGAQGEAGKDAQPEVKFENGKWFLWNGTEFVEFKGAEATAANIPYCYEDPADPNYTILVAYTQDGVENKIRLPRTSGLGQIVVLDGANLSIVYNTFNGAHFKNGKATDWTEGTKALPEKGEYMLTANVNAIYVQVVPADYDISKLNFKLVNMKGDEAPIVLGAPVPCTEARSNVSESGVYAISFTLPEMTDAVYKEYQNNIAGKKLSLVATESVRSTYTSSLSVSQASSNNFGECSDVKKADKQPYTVEFDSNADNVYDAFLTMGNAAAKADSVKYGIKIDGMTISHNDNMPENKTIRFTINQITARAVVNSESKVSVTFNPTEATVIKTIALDAVAPHNPVALLKNNAGQVINKIAQSIVVDFEPYFKAMGMTDANGDRLIWNENSTRLDVEKVMWTHVDKNTGAVLEEQVTDLVEEDLVYLDKNGADKQGNSVALKDFSKLRIQFTQNYGSKSIFGDGTLVATINVKGKDADDRVDILQKVEVPFSFNDIAAAEKASWFDWNKANSYTTDGLVCYTQKLTKDIDGNYLVKLSDYFNVKVKMVDDLNLVDLRAEQLDATKSEWTPNMTIGYPSAIFESMTTDVQKNAAKDEVTWTGFNNPCWNSNPDPTTLKSEITIKNSISDKYFGTYTISGIKVKAMNREISVANLKLVIKGQASRADVISFSKALVIPSVQNEYIKLTNTAFAPYGGTFFGTFTLKDYQGRSYELQNNTTITVADVAADGSYDFTTVSNVIRAEVVEYAIDKDDTKACGIKFIYKQDTEYPAGKVFKVMLKITGAKKDGVAASDIVVPATITVGGI